MALITAAVCMAVVCAILLISVAFGNRILEFAEFVISDPLDNILFSTGIGFAVLQFLLGLLGLATGLTRVKVIILLIVIAAAAGRGWNTLPRLGKESWLNLLAVLASRATKLLAICIGFFLVLEAILSTAPLSGSDAMHYHFTAPLLHLGNPDRPIFWLTHSFLTGLGHELIELGLALGSDRISLLLIFLGGCATAAALFQLARQWMPEGWALAATLIFLATPIVFWQITTAGSPDIWMAFYILLAVLAVSQVAGPGKDRWLVLASFYSGAAAGIKYTGWIIPFIVILCVLWLSRSIWWTAFCSLAALVSGALPQLRNLAWTGDPFFPFLGRWIGRIAANPYGMQMLQADTRAHAFSMEPLHLLWLPVAMVLRGADYGLGNYFGPIVLAFLPLLFFCRWKMRAVWFAAALWLSMFLANALTTQMSRFLLPAYPLALALVFSGAAVAFANGRWPMRYGCALTLVVFGLFSLVLDAGYSKDFLPVALGLESKEAFLDRMAPDHQTAKFVNAALEHRQGNAMVFFRHLYYLRVPYVNGDPASSWDAAPDRLTSPQMLLEFLHQQDVRWVVKTGSYPPALAATLEECEREGSLVLETRIEIENLSGASRILNNRIKVPVVLMRVAN